MKLIRAWRTARLVYFSQMQRHAGVTPIDFGRLDETFGAIHCIGGADAPRESSSPFSHRQDEGKRTLGRRIPVDNDPTVVGV